MGGGGLTKGREPLSHVYMVQALYSKPGAGDQRFELTQILQNKSFFPVILTNYFLMNVFKIQKYKIRSDEIFLADRPAQWRTLVNHPGRYACAIRTLAEH